MASPLVVGHQGSSEGVAPATLAAYEAAAAAGAEMLEVDVRRTADGELLVLHDPDVEGAPVSSLAAADVRAAVAPPVAAFADVVGVAAGAARLLLVDLKGVGYELDAVDLALARLDPERVVVSTLEDASVALLRRERPAVEVGLSIGRDRPRPYVRTRLSELFPVERARRAGARFLSVNRRLVPLGVVARAARAGLPVLVWTVDGDRELRRLLRDDRLHGVITNRPRRAVELRGPPDG